MMNTSSDQQENIFSQQQAITDILKSNITEVEDETTDTLEITQNSWVPIFMSLLLTLLQSIVCLLFFEWARRCDDGLFSFRNNNNNKPKNRKKKFAYSSLYDKARLHRPDRTPPPLMRYRGLCTKDSIQHRSKRWRGYFGFEWWRLGLSKEYYVKSHMEYKQRLKEQPAIFAQQRRNNCNNNYNHYNNTVHISINDRYVLMAIQRTNQEEFSKWDEVQATKGRKFDLAPLKQNETGINHNSIDFADSTSITNEDGDNLRTIEEEETEKNQSVVSGSTNVRSDLNSCKLHPFSHAKDCPTNENNKEEGEKRGSAAVVNSDSELFDLLDSISNDHQRYENSDNTSSSSSPEDDDHSSLSNGWRKRATDKEEFMNLPHNIVGSLKSPSEYLSYAYLNNDNDNDKCQYFEHGDKKEVTTSNVDSKNELNSVKCIMDVCSDNKLECTKKENKAGAKNGLTFSGSVLADSNRDIDKEKNTNPDNSNYGFTARQKLASTREYNVSTFVDIACVDDNNNGSNDCKRDEIDHKGAWSASSSATSFDEKIEQQFQRLQPSQKRIFFKKQGGAIDENCLREHSPTLYVQPANSYNDNGSCSSDEYLEKYKTPLVEELSLNAQKIVTKMNSFVSKRIVMVPDDDEELSNNDDPPHQNDNMSDGEEAMNFESRNERNLLMNSKDSPHYSLFVRQVNRRPLNKSQEELLRCIGLDAFVTLRFLRFCFDVSFWPFLLSCITVVPVYSTAEGSRFCQNNQYCNITVHNVASSGGDKYRLWATVIFAVIQYVYFLRRLWVEWEHFIPLRYNWLERGDFYNGLKYQDQYRKTCIVEYIPRTHRRDEDLYDFFDLLFPGQVRRAEVLINTETLAKLIKARHRHIVAYEDGMASRIHKLANYYRYENEKMKQSHKNRWVQRKEPKQPKVNLVDRFMILWNKQMDEVETLQDEGDIASTTTASALAYHRQQVCSLNKAIDKEILRLAKGKHPTRKKKRARESYIGKLVGAKYITASETETKLHSSTAFVEFSSATAKQQAIQCNITGTCRCMEVSPVPSIKEIIWNNAHISRNFINTRKNWANVLLFIGLIFWSRFVAYMRSDKMFATKYFVPFEIEENSTIEVLLDTYIPILIIEGLVLLIPIIIDVTICRWIRFKMQTNIDYYTLRWYLGYRLVTFIFVIIVGSLVDTTTNLLKDPVRFVENLANNVPEQSQYFVSYVIISTGFSAYYLSQGDVICLAWFRERVVTEEATSSRRVEETRREIQKFPCFRLIPVFVFVMMVGLLYGSLAPISNLAVAFFSRIAYKSYKCLNLFMYGKVYEGGGKLFYTLNHVVFFLLYMMIILIAGYLSLAGDIAMAYVFLLMMPVTIFVHIGIWRTFFEPSTTLALTKARVSDEREESKTKVNSEVDDLNSLEHEEKSMADSSEDSKALEKFTRRYENSAFDNFSDALDSGAIDCYGEYFIYRQPILNRKTWEVQPRPYRSTNPRNSYLDYNNNTGMVVGLPQRESYAGMPSPMVEELGDHETSRIAPGDPNESFRSGLNLLEDENSSKISIDDESYLA